MMREAVTYNKFYNTFTDFKLEIRSFFKDKIPILKDTLKTRMNDTFQVPEVNPVRLPM